MPEGPEVKIIVSWLNKNIKNKILSDIHILNGRYKRHDNPINWDKLKHILPIKIKSVNCKGKFIWFEFYNTELTIWNTLGMSGWWNYNNYKHNNILFIINNKNIYFNDVRNFGTIKICNISNLKKKLNLLGPDILNNNNNFLEFQKRLFRKRDNTLIANALLDQKVISGIGNYLRSDILWYSKISPFRKIKNLLINEIKLIYKNSKKLGQRALKKHSNQFNKDDILHPSLGQNVFYVYSKNIDKYNNKIIRKKINNRSIFYVPKIQK